jgi:hypothetical protein
MAYEEDDFMKSAPIGSLALLMTVALAACDDANGPSELDQALNEDVALVVADAVIEDVQQMYLSLGGAEASEVALDVAAPPRNFSRTVEFFDADGNPQDAYNPETTASIHIVSEMSGAIERDNWTATVTRSRDMMVTGLEGQETSRTWNGTTAGTSTRSQVTDENGTRSYEMDMTGTIEDVVRLLPRLTHPWPASGTITRHITITITNGPNGDEVRERDVTITFNNTQYATLTIDGEEYEIDLAAQEHQRGVRRRNHQGG